MPLVGAVHKGLRLAIDETLRTPGIIQGSKKFGWGREIYVRCANCKQALRDGRGHLGRENDEVLERCRRAVAFMDIDAAVAVARLVLNAVFGLRAS
jgi:hypothetical protein